MGALTKVSNLGYIPGSSGRPPSPGYSYQQCEYETVEVIEEYFVLVCGGWFPALDPLTNVFLGYYRFVVGSGDVCLRDVHTRKTYKTITKNCKTVHVPADPGKPATQGKQTQSVIIGWNAGARSIEPVSERTSLRFSVPSTVVGVFVGLSRDDASTDYRDLTHAIYFHRGEFEIYEDGQPVGVSGSYASSDVFEIRRRGNAVTYHREVL